MKKHSLDVERPTLRVGFIGSGFLAGSHARAVRAVGAIPAGVASSASESAERAGVRLGLLPASSHVDHLLAEHVICERPLATSSTDAERLTGLDAEAEVGRRTGAQILLRDAASLDPSAARNSVVPAGHPQGYHDAFNAVFGDAHAAMGGRVRDGLSVFAGCYRSAVLTEAIRESNARRTCLEVPAHPPHPLVPNPPNASTRQA